SDLEALSVFARFLFYFNAHQNKIGILQIRIKLLVPQCEQTFFYIFHFQINNAPLYWKTTGKAILNVLVHFLSIHMFLRANNLPYTALLILVPLEVFLR